MYLTIAPIMIWCVYMETNCRFKKLYNLFISELMVVVHRTRFLLWVDRAANLGQRSVGTVRVADYYSAKWRIIHFFTTWKHYLSAKYHPHHCYNMSSISSNRNSWNLAHQDTCIRRQTLWCDPFIKNISDITLASSLRIKLGSFILLELANVLSLISLITTSYIGQAYLPLARFTCTTLVGRSWPMDRNKEWKRRHFLRLQWTS